MGLNYYASSPVLIPPSPAAFPHSSIRRHALKYPQPPPSLNYLARVSSGLTSRKRSRDGDDDHDGEIEASSRPITVPQSMPEPIMGTGMTLSHPDETAMHISPESQPATWMKESDEIIESARPRLIARKSRCRIQDLPEVQNVAHSDEIDPIVRQLGIGWKRLNETQQSAIAGSEMVIHKYFDLHNPTIVLHHEGLGIYVVRSEPASAQGYWNQWWLFREDLKSSRFLCNDESLFDRLNHKRCDERGHWVPDIRYNGPEVFPKGSRPAQSSTPGAELATTSIGNTTGDVLNAEQTLQIQNHTTEDIEMAGVA